MTEFRQTTEELNSVEDFIASAGSDVSRSAGDKLEKLIVLKAKLEGDLANRVSKFEKRLTEKDPVSGNPRYGPSMTAKVVALGERRRELLERMLVLEGELGEERRRHSARQTADAELAAKREAEREDAEEARQMIRMRQAEEEQRRAEATKSILDKQREEAALEAKRGREERQMRAREEQRRLEEDKARREREAAELTSSVAVGAAGVEDGLRRIEDACGGRLDEKKAAVHALYQILRNVASNPEEPRFRRIKKDNESFRRAVGRFEGGVQILLSSGFRMQVEEGQTVLVMNEPDLDEDMDAWSEWYKNITEAIERLKLELDERF